MSSRIMLCLLTIGMFFLLTSCAPATNPINSPQDEQPGDTLESPEPSVPPEETDMPSDSIDQDQNLPLAVQVAIQDLAESLGISSELIEVVEYEQVDWPDSCLGFAGRDVACLQVITPGYRVILSANGVEYEYHTDDSGLNIRLSPGSLQSSTKPGLDINKPAALLAAMQHLRDALGVPIEDITFDSIEEVEWPDTCLGLAQTGEVCAQMIVPGWLILLDTGGEQYELHSDLTGSNIRLK
jgi:hypothetical protein